MYKQRKCQNAQNGMFPKNKFPLNDRLIFNEL